MEAIDLAEDRKQFENLLNRLGSLSRPAAAVRSVEEALNTAETIGYPVLVRPSYVLGGRAMEIVHNATDLIRYVAAPPTQLSPRAPMLIDRYLEGKELEVDAICDGEQVLIPGLMEHVERAGVHSGDSMAVYPAIGLTPRSRSTPSWTTRRGSASASASARAASTSSTCSSRATIFVIEVNPRASRTVPFLSKATGVPIVTVATRVMLGQRLAARAGVTRWAVARGRSWSR